MQKVRNCTVHHIIILRISSLRLKYLTCNDINLTVIVRFYSAPYVESNPSLVLRKRVQNPERSNT